MYSNSLTVLLSVFLLVNGLDLECSVETIEQLFTSSTLSESERKCELCEILKSKLDISHCQTNLLPAPCISSNPYQHPPQLFYFNQSDNNNPHQSQQSIHWDRVIPSNNNNNNNNNDQPIFHVLIKRSNNNDDQEQPEYLYLTFPTYPTKILPKICSRRQHPLHSPFGHLCPLNTKCVEDESINVGYICECEDECNKTWLLRKILEWIQIVCIVICVLLCLVVYWLRKTKVGQWAIWPITESILFGSILLYISVILKIEIPSNTALLCLLEPWARELGFTLVYGGILLKIYRSLVEFRTRKAHRWVVREKDILRYLLTMTMVIVFYMTSWTVTNKYYSGDGGIEFHDHLYCPVTWWHRVTEFGEVLFLCVGLNMAWHLRRAPVSPFKSYYTAALLLESTTNVIGIVIRECRFIFVDEDEIFLMVLHFVKCQITTTIIIFLVVAPKLYYIREEKRKRQLRRGDTTTSGLGAGRKALEAAINNGDLDFADINIADMDPQDIRLELKRVYTQLELLRNKTMRKDNPHISRRRGGRKQTHRRFSLQALRRQQQQQQHYQQQPQPQRFRGGYAHDDIEDSVCSIEGPSTYSEAGR
ncbi:probable G-protein coupled receptor 158 isoform X2 [Folsomia candida]|uniref:probable G-protein coupled receptor 158 isoform X2 n=1 Tax=Folsomia candida TaxID=158441 RepID=UPI00160503BF|nr:probable G-protein coupled receptor 158 isoform X2 [Folsomia candida]